MSSHVLVLVSGSADGERDLGLDEDALYIERKAKAFKISSLTQTGIVQA